MKKFGKLIPAALGLLTLASCSSDDFFSEKTDAQLLEELGKGDLIVGYESAIEDGSYFTRAWKTDLDNQGNFQVKYGFEDDMRVYDTDLHKYDIYTYSTRYGEKNAFRLNTSRIDDQGYPVSNITDPRYALFPHEDVISGHWDYNEKSGQTRTTARVKINDYIQYDCTNYPVNSTDYVPVFEDAVPYWGSVSVNDKGALETNLRPLTGILKLRVSGVPEYAQYIKVMMIDKQTGKTLNMNGVYQATIATNDIPDLNAEVKTTGPAAYPSVDLDGEPYYDLTEFYSKFPVIDPKTGVRVNVNDDFNADGYDDAIWVNMERPSHDVDDWNTEWQKKAVVYVPLVTTPNRQVDIVCVAAYKEVNEDGVTVWKEKTFKTFSNKTIRRNVYYGNGSFYNFAIDGEDPCSINDALEQATPDADGVILLTAMNAIGITKDCHTITIPNKEGASKIIIDLSKGLYATDYTGALQVIYEEDTKFTGDVAIIAGKAEGQDEGDGVGAKKSAPIDVQLDKSGFGLAGTGFTDLTIDAEEFLLGDGENLTVSDNELTLSDNVTALTIAEKAVLEVENSENAYQLDIPNEKGEKGYQNKGLESIDIFGVMKGIINAPEAEVDLYLNGINSVAALHGAIRTQGTITGAGTSILFNNEEVENQKVQGFAAYGRVELSDQAIAIGPLFSKKGDIIINNDNVNGESWAKFGKKLSDVIYAVPGNHVPATGASIEEYINQYIDADGFFKGYGPLYSEESSVKISLKNDSKVRIRKTTDPNSLAIVKEVLSKHPEETVDYAVYAAQDVEFITDETSKLKANANIWAEYDITFDGDVKLISGKNTISDRFARADHDFVMKKLAYAQAVEVGHNATVDVDDQDGACEAISSLYFSENKTEGNKLFLNGGYIENIYNTKFKRVVVAENGEGRLKGDMYYAVINYEDPAKDAFPVQLWFDVVGRYAAIAQVVGDIAQLIPQNASVWNGEFMPEELVSKYFIPQWIKTEEEASPSRRITRTPEEVSEIPTQLIWTATMLAQLEKAKEVQGELHARRLAPYPSQEVPYTVAVMSDINLNNYDWTGILVDRDFEIAGFGDEQKVISGIKLVAGKPNNDEVLGIGFIKNAPALLAADNLHLKVSTAIAPTDETIDGVGGLAGVVAGNAYVQYVTVELSGNFGSDGVNNVQLSNIGGIFGNATENVILKGVRVGCNGAKLSGYANMGGFIGLLGYPITTSEEGITIGADQNKTLIITDCGATDDLGAKSTAVNGLTVNVTYCETGSDDNPSIQYPDTKQGTTGLYVGSANLNEYKIDIKVTEDNVFENYNFEGLADWSKAWWAHTNIDIDQNTYSYVKFVYNHGNQSLIGQCGDILDAANMQVKINGKSYFVKATGDSSQNFTNALYVLVVTEGTLVAAY